MLRCREQGVEISLTALHAFAGEEALNGTDAILRHNTAM